MQDDDGELVVYAEKETNPFVAVTAAGKYQLNPVIQCDLQIILRHT